MASLPLIIHETAAHCRRHGQSLFRPILPPLAFLFIAGHGVGVSTAEADNAFLSVLALSVSFFIATAVEAFILTRALASINEERLRPGFLPADPREPRLLFFLFIVKLIVILLLLPLLALLSGDAPASLNPLLLILTAAPLLALSISPMILLPDCFQTGVFRFHPWLKLSLADKLGIGFLLMIPAALFGLFLILPFMAATTLLIGFLAPSFPATLLVVTLGANYLHLIFLIVNAVLLGVIHRHYRSAMNRGDHGS